jgi:2,3-bisphosphoglycerate-dependent phosphoglycerate mutase
MRITIRFVVALVFSVSFFTVQAQSKTTTIILVRHAEKEVVTNGDKMMQADPPLSAEGKVRAESLVGALKDFIPNAIYSTNYERTRATVTPLSGKHGIEIQYYDPRNQQPLADKLKSMTGQTIVVTGHSNSVPGLVNMLVGEDKYANLEDSVYNKIFIVTITDGKASVEVREY